MTSPARRIGRAAVLVGVLSAALAAAGPDALVPFEDLARAAGAEATVSVAFVIDFGGPAGPVVGCARVPSGTTGYQALAAFAAQQQEQDPTYNAAGLLCSIDGRPASGCGQAVPGGYAYWSYWHGSTGSWQYASAGAFADVQAGDVEGWRFEDPGKANASDPPPGATPDYAAICGTVTSTTAPPRRRHPPLRRRAPTTPVGAATGGSTAPPSTTPGSPAGPAAPTSTAPVPATAPGTGPAVRHVPPSAARRPATSAQSLRAAPASRGSGGGALPAILGGGLVVVLAALALWRWRRRPADP